MANTIMQGINHETFAVLAKMAGVPDDRIEAHITETEGFIGVSAHRATSKEARAVLGAVISIDPFAVNDVSMSRPNEAREGEKTATITLGAKPPGV